MQNQFSIHTSRITDFRLHGVRNSRNGRVAVTSFTVHGQNAFPTRGFWMWIIANFASGITSVYDQAELFDRLRSEQPDAEIEYEIGWDEDGNALLLAPLAQHLRNRPMKSSFENRITSIANQSDKHGMQSRPGLPRFSLN